MSILSLKVLDINGKTLAASHGTDFVDLVYSSEYHEGDRIELQSSDKNIHINWQVDDALGSAFVFFKDTEQYVIPFGDKRICYSPKVFAGSKHYIYAEVASKSETALYRNLALNPADQHREVHTFPHASANVETRGESVFEARNAIDGVRANLSHGEWPYGSWGINRRADAEMTIDFGREVTIDRLVFYLRSDFPHDSWWTQATVTFSDGSREIIPLTKTSEGQSFTIAKRTVSSLVLSDLIKADDPSPFPALTQLEVYGVAVSE